MKEWQQLEEIIGVVLHRLGDRLGDRSVEVSLTPDMPLVPFDALLIEQVLANLMENVIKYAPDGSKIELNATCGPEIMTVELADQGPGIPPEQAEREAAVGG